MQLRLANSCRRAPTLNVRSRASLISSRAAALAASAAPSTSDAVLPNPTIAAASAVQRARAAGQRIGHRRAPPPLPNKHQVWCLHPEPAWSHSMHTNSTVD